MNNNYKLGHNFEKGGAHITSCVLWLATTISAVLRADEILGAK